MLTPFVTFLFRNTLLFSVQLSWTSSLPSLSPLSCSYSSLQSIQNLLFPARTSHLFLGQPISLLPSGVIRRVYVCVLISFCVRKYFNDPGLYWFALSSVECIYNFFPLFVASNLVHFANFEMVLLGKNFLFYTASRPVLGPPSASYPKCTGASYRGIKRPGLEADFSTRTSAEVNKMWSYTSTPPYAFMV
jgi:hypothetical protein